jgi:hypothetical protein
MSLGTDWNSGTGKGFSDFSVPEFQISSGPVSELTRNR